MDPTSTTLYTFHFLTDPSVQSVTLFGSWDNFTRTHTMERDSRRHCGQWRACHAFEESGGLKMGETYFYYYEVDGTTETHDPSLPSTTACPSMPGQPMNTLFVPVQQSPPRKRSASVSSLRRADYMTVRPDDKFTTPRAAPPVPPCRRMASTSHVPSPLQPQHKRSVSKRSLGDTTPTWPWSPRKLFARSKSASSASSRGDSDDEQQQQSEAPRATPPTSFPMPPIEGERAPARPSSRSGSGSRSRDMSPESLRRFLSGDAISPTTTVPPTLLPEQPLALAIPEEIAEEADDDDNFATSARSESLPFFTVLSPPPSQRGLRRPAHRPTTPRVPEEEQPQAASSPQSTASGDIPSFYHSSDDDDDGSDDDDEEFTFRPLQSIAPDADSFGKSLMSAFSGYSLPGGGDRGGAKTADLREHGSGEAML